MTLRILDFFCLFLISILSHFHIVNFRCISKLFRGSKNARKQQCLYPVSLGRKLNPHQQQLLNIYHTHAWCCAYLWAREPRSSPLKAKILREKKQLCNSLQNESCMSFLVKVIKEMVSWESPEESWSDPWTVVVSSKMSAWTEPKAWAA